MYTSTCCLRNEVFGEKEVSLEILLECKKKWFREKQGRSTAEIGGIAKGYGNNFNNFATFFYMVVP